MVRSFLLIAALAVLAGCSGSASDATRTQLAASAQVTPEQAERLSVSDLALIKHVRGSSNYSESEKQLIINGVLEGVIPRVRFNLFN